MARAPGRFGIRWQIHRYQGEHSSLEGLRTAGHPMGELALEHSSELADTLRQGNPWKRPAGPPHLRDSRGLHGSPTGLWDASETVSLCGWRLTVAPVPSSRAACLQLGCCAGRSRTRSPVILHLEPPPLLLTKLLLGAISRPSVNQLNPIGDQKRLRGVAAPRFEPSLAYAAGLRWIPSRGRLIRDV